MALYSQPCCYVKTVTVANCSRPRLAPSQVKAKCMPVTKVAPEASSVSEKVLQLLTQLLFQVVAPLLQLTTHLLAGESLDIGPHLHGPEAAGYSNGNLGGLDRKSTRLNSSH